jgi:indolepyruvate ferredoxin oxidoreductase alpha subunit
MTGHQDHPASGRNFNDITDTIPIRGVLEGLGVKNIYETDAYRQTALADLVRRAVAYDTFSVVIARHPCMLKFNREQRRKPGFRAKRVAIDQQLCDRRHVCIADFGCPTFSRGQEGVIAVNADLCIGDGSCVQTCPSRAIKAPKSS